MITLQKLDIFVHYKGDGDMFARSTRHKDLITDAEWDLIDTLLQDATVINRKLGSKERTAQASQRLKKHCENEGVIAEIKRLAETNL